MAAPIFNLYRIRVREMLQDSIDYLVEKYKQSRKVFTVASAYGQILYVLESLTNFIFYYIEDSTTEQNIRQATRDSSIYGIAEQAGYRVSRSVAASGQIAITPKRSIIDNIPNNILIIPNYTRVKCLNNTKTYIMVLTQDELKLSTTSYVSTPIYIQQGSIETQTFTGKGKEFESISVPFPKSFYIDNFLVNVYVNDTKWNPYKNLLHMPRGENAYMIKTGANSLDIFFGTNNYGNYPGIGNEIKVEYLTTDGYSGRIDTENPADLTFEFVDTGFTQFGDEVQLNDVFDIVCTLTPDYGSNPEPISLTKLMLTKAEIGLVDLPSYELMMKRMQAFSIIRAYRDDLDLRMVNLFLVPDISKLIKPNESYFTIPEERFILSNTKQNHILQYIEKNGTKMVGSDCKIINPVISKYVLNISVIIFNDTPPEIIKSDIVKVLSDYFLSINRRARIPRSDLIKIIEEVNGVDSVNIRIVSQKNEALKLTNPNAADIGVDEFNDIIISDNELPIIRGGWSDRNGNRYDKGLSEVGLGAVNITVRDITERPKN